MNGVTNVCPHWQALHKQLSQVDKIVCGKAQRQESSGGGGMEAQGHPRHVHLNCGKMAQPPESCGNALREREHRALAVGCRAEKLFSFIFALL